jgi:TRAP-type C4-dicarboxylate transport system permease small subunit
VDGRLARPIKLAALGVAALLAWYSIRLVVQSYAFNDISTGLDATPLWIPQLGMAIGTTIFTLAFALDLADLVSGRKIVEAPKEGEPARVE